MLMILIYIYSRIGSMFMMQDIFKNLDCICEEFCCSIRLVGRGISGVGIGCGVRSSIGLRCRLWTGVGIGICCRSSTSWICINLGH